MHLCSGNFTGTHAAAGNCEPVAEALLSQMQLDAFFLANDHHRSGDFKPLRYLSKDKVVALGMASTRFDKMKSEGALKRRIDEAAKYAPLDLLCLGRQRSATCCGGWWQWRRKGGPDEGGRLGGAASSVPQIS